MSGLDEDDVEILRSILAKKRKLADREKYEAAGTPDEMRIEGKVRAYRWLENFLHEVDTERLEEEDEELARRLE